MVHFKVQRGLDEDFLKQRRYERKNLGDKEKEGVDAAQESTKRKERHLPKAERTDWSRPGALVKNYIERFRRILDERPTPERRERAMEALKSRLHDDLIIHPDNVPESYFDSIKNRHRDEGHGDIEIPEDLKAELTDTAIDEQTRSLDAWIDYLASDDAKYPDSLKYWAFRSILKMGRYDKEKKKFTNREGKGSVSPFPDLNREALAIVLGDLEKKYAGTTDYQFTSRYDIDETQKQAYRKAIENENFPEAYALAIDAFKPVSEELLKITDGEWRTFQRGSNPRALVDSISNYGTGWCIRGEPTARRYLESNDMHIYYSKDKEGKEGKPVVPRVVMVVNPANQIAEVRGIEKHEHLDSHIGDVVETKLEEHPDGEKYKKKSEDMRRLTEIEHKTKKSEPFTKDDLTFLYEVDSRIEGFGYEAAGRDPRIEEIRSKRNIKEDLPVLFDCTPDDIATSPSDISATTKAYIGPLESGIFTTVAKHGIEHVYTSFPEGHIRLESLDIGGMTAEELENALDREKINVSSYARSMLKNKRQFVNPANNRESERRGETESLDLVRLRVRDLGFTSPPTTREIFVRAKEFGLELCPPETAVYQRFADKDQPSGWYYIGMEPVTGSDGHPYVFVLERSDGGLWLSGDWARPDSQWFLDYQVVFRVRKSDA